MGFKVGDKVMVKDSLQCDSFYDEVYFNPKMGVHKGKVLEISEVNDDYDGKKRYTLKDAGCWAWSKDMLEYVPNYKYKVGEKVRVKSNLKVGESYCMADGVGHDSFVGEMAYHSGCVVTISEMSMDKYRVEECAGWNFTDEMLEPVQEVVPEPTPTPIPKAEKTKIDFIATAVSHFIVIGDVTICIPLDCPVGVAVKHPDDMPNTEIGMGLSQLRMINDAEANGLI
jgi:hypothetical protein